MRNFYKHFNHFIISKIMINAFSFHRIMVNVLLIMINILFHRNWNIEWKRRPGTISRQSPPSSVKFLSGLFTILNFLHPKALKIQTHRGESRFSRVLLWRVVTTRLWPGHQQQQQQLYLYPTVYRNIGEEYRLPQITIGAKQKWHPILRWFIHNHLGQISHTHTHKHKAHACACALNSKTNKIKKVKDVKVKKNNEKPDELWCENTLQFLVAFKNN